VQESKVKRSDRLNDRVKTDGTDTTDRITFAANAVDTDLRVGDEGGVRELLRGSEFVDRSGRLLRLHDEASVETLAAPRTPPFVHQLRSLVVVSLSRRNTHARSTYRTLIAS